MGCQVTSESTAWHPSQRITVCISTTEAREVLQLKKKIDFVTTYSPTIDEAEARFVSNTHQHQTELMKQAPLRGIQIEGHFRTGICVKLIKLKGKLCIPFTGMKYSSIKVNKIKTHIPLHTSRSESSIGVRWILKGCHFQVPLQRNCGLALQSQALDAEI